MSPLVVGLTVVKGASERRSSFSEHAIITVMSDSVTPWTVACQAPPGLEFSRQE